MLNVSKSFDYSAGSRTCQREEMGTSVMSSVRPLNRSVIGFG